MRSRCNLRVTSRVSFIITTFQRICAIWSNHFHNDLSLSLSSQEEDDQENYDDMADLRSPPPPPIPPPPSKTPAPSVSRRRPDPPVDTSNVYSQYPNGINLQNVFVALWDFSSSARDELSVQRGDLVHVVDPNPKVQWWAGEALDQNAASKTGLYGFLPSSYVEAAFELV